MAGNKKKRKPIQNPSRGFQTSSLPSKTKTMSSEPPDTTSTGQSSDKDQGQHESYPRHAEDVHSQQPQVSLGPQDMTAEQLEDHLERSELQAALTAHGQKTKSDASKAGARLQTERRLIRSQALFLDTKEWLRPELKDNILDRARAESFEKSVGSRAPKKLLEHLTPEMDTCIRLWKLRRTLVELGFPDPPGALQTTVSSRSANDEYTVGSKEAVWGLDEALVYIALHLSDCPVFSYDCRPLKNALKAVSLESNGLSETSPETTTSPNQQTEQAQLAGNSDAVEESKAEAANDRLSDTDEEIDPEYLQDRYVEIKTQLFQIEHNLQTPEAPGQAVLQSKQKQKLQKALSKIQHDVLFDQNEALLMWRTKEIELRKSLSQKLHTALATHRTKARDELKPRATENDSARTTESSNITEVESMLGPLFEQEVTGDLGESPEAGQSDTGSILLQDFGKVVGNPRRVLEENCRATDPGCRVLFQSVSQAAYSNRHRLQIVWSKDFEQFTTSNFRPERVSFLTTSRSVEACMESIATPTAAQSEAYISVVTLFCLFVDSSKGEKPYVRLATVWREIWDDLFAARRESIYAEDMATLKSILEMIQQCGPFAHHPNENVTTQRSKLLDERPVHHSTKDLTNPSRTDWATFWRHKSSTPLYQRMLQARQSLPIWKSRREILQTLDSHQVIIISGETGSGKSTQIPSFLLEHDMLAGKDCRVLVTEPRRISAMSLARRVSEELGEAKSDVGSVNSLVGYAVRLESKVSSSTRITFATNGVVMRMLENPDAFHDIRYIVLDEVHERNIDTDFLLIVLRKLLPNRPHLRLIMMSATFDADNFAQYFGDSGSLPPVLKVPGRLFPVEIKYLEDVIEMTKYNPQGRFTRNIDDDVYAAIISGHRSEDEDTSATKSATTGLHGYSAETRATLSGYDEYRIDFLLITRAIDFVASDPQLRQYSEAFLVFLPGIAEIRRLQQTIQSDYRFDQDWKIFMLHSSIPSEDQERAFVKLGPGVRKIVLSTNIAETGITIPDITTVIDTGKEKVMRFDERRQMSKLTESFISKASSKQRQGRAARVRPGLALKLYTKDRHHRLMPDQTAPEMVRLSLQDPVLRVKLYDMGGIEDILSQAPTPPTTRNVRRAVDALREVKALTASEELTPLGRQLARLPLDIWLGKMILTSLAFQCLDCAVTVASILTSKSPFLDLESLNIRPAHTREAFRRGDSDPLLTYNAYAAWKRATEAGNTQEFLRNHRFLSGQALSTIEDQKTQLLVSLVDAGILQLDDAEKSSLRRARVFTQRRHFFTTPVRYDVNGQNDVAITTTIASAFYPKLLIREGNVWKNVARNQPISLSPQSVLRSTSTLPRLVSFYQTAQSRNKNVLAHDLTPVDDFAAALFLGDAEFKLYAGVIAVDGSRLRFAIKDLHTMVALLVLRTRISEVMTQRTQHPKRPLSDRQKVWAEIWQTMMEDRWRSRDKQITT